MIYCIWYPSGGFGHFVNAVLTLHGNNFVRPTNNVKFSPDGDLHHLNLVLPKYFHNQKYRHRTDNLASDKNYTVLIDNGITDESTKFAEEFENAKIVKICYTDYSWPIIAKTSIVKASKVQLINELPLGQDWESTDNWAIREKYFLYLKDHHLRQAWKPSPGALVLSLDDLIEYNDMNSCLTSLDLHCTDFSQLHKEMLLANQQHFISVQLAKKIINAIVSDNHISTKNITDLWDQAVINYFLYLEFGIEVPANTYANWFTNTKEISKLC